eukprot:1365621-Amphidinium_carterae.1
MITLSPPLGGWRIPLCAPLPHTKAKPDFTPSDGVRAERPIELDATGTKALDSSRLDPVHLVLSIPHIRTRGKISRSLLQISERSPPTPRPQW